MIPLDTPIGTRCRSIASVRIDPHYFEIGEEVKTEQIAQEIKSGKFELACIASKDSSACWSVDLEELERIELTDSPPSSPLTQLISNISNLKL